MRTLQAPLLGSTSIRLVSRPASQVRLQSLKAGGAQTPACTAPQVRLSSLTLTSIGDVGNGGAMHVAGPAQVVVVSAAMHRAAIVPHHEIVQAPAMSVDELRLGGMGDQLVD